MNNHSTYKKQNSIWILLSNICYPIVTQLKLISSDTLENGVVWQFLRSQFGTSNSWGGTRYLPMVFTEHGVLMLSSVLSSGQAIQVNIQIMRVFTQVRQLLFDNTELRLAIEETRKKTDNNVKNIEIVFQYLDELLERKEKPKTRKPIGYKIPKKK